MGSLFPWAHSMSEGFSSFILFMWQLLCFLKANGVFLHIQKTLG